LETESKNGPTSEGVSLVPGFDDLTHERKLKPGLFLYLDVQAFLVVEL
jgi:hypothetical protein